MSRIDQDEIRRTLMAGIANADSLSEAVEFYKLGQPLLRDCKFVFAAKSGGTPGFAVNRTFSAGAAIRSLFGTEHVLVLDAETLNEMFRGKATYPFDYSISLDTQALSYLEPYLAAKVTRLPSDFKEVFDFIARTDVYVDPMPYLLENLHNLGSQRSNELVFEKLKAYEVLRTIDSAWLKTRAEVRSVLSKPELEKRAQEHIARLLMDRGDPMVMQSLNLRHMFTYSILLKMVSVQLRVPSASVNRKMEIFSEFCDADLATMCARESAIARAYFECGQGLGFFDKIQKKRAGLFESLDGMAWDLWHVRQLEEAMTFQLSAQARYYFPALLTFDKRLIEIMDLYPLKACAFRSGHAEPMPFYDGDWFDFVATDPAAKAKFTERFFSKEAIASREYRRGVQGKRIAGVVEMLENEVSLLAEVQLSDKSTVLT